MHTLNGAFIKLAEFVGEQGRERAISYSIAATALPSLMAGNNKTNGPPRDNDFSIEKRNGEKRLDFIVIITRVVLSIFSFIATTEPVNTGAPPGHWISIHFISISGPFRRRLLYFDLIYFGRN